MDICDFLIVLCLAPFLGGCDRLSAPGGGTGGGTPPGGGPGPIAAHAGPGARLVSLVPDRDRIRIDWTSEGLDGLELALFLSDDEDSLLNRPVAIDPSENSFIVSGLAEGILHFAAIGAREVQTAGDFVRLGPKLRATTGPPVYVDTTANAGAADGLTPGTAFQDLFPAVLTAFAAGGGNVWVRGGVYEGTALALLDGVDLYGGFGADFDLAARDPESTPSTLTGSAGASVIDLDGSAPAVIDGFTLDGLGLSESGIDVDSVPIEIRSVRVTGCSRGVKLRGSLGDVPEVVIVHSAFTANSTQGLSVEGAFDLSFEDSLFELNGQEGFDMGDWIAPTGERVTLRVNRCRFLANGSHGLDVNLAAPLALGTPGGRFRIVVGQCEFSQNSGDGMLIDIDYENAPDWSAEIEVRGVRARANALSGVRLDLDSRAGVLLHRLLASANGGDGLTISSESLSGMATVSASAFIGNRGVGVRSTFGNFGVVLSHCAFAGNLVAGSSADVTPSVAVSSVAYLETDPWLETLVHESVATTNNLAPPFAAIPAQFLWAIGQDGSTLALEGMPDFGLGALCEVADDGLPRTAAEIGSGTLLLEPEPVSLLIPALVTYHAGVGVEEDFALTMTSVAVGAGMSPPFGAAVDAGPIASPAGGAPGAEEALRAPLFWVADSDPPWVQPIAPTQALAFAFEGGIPDPSTLGDSVFVVDGDGVPLPIDAMVQAEQLIVMPPAGGWQSGLFVELHGGLVATDGTPLSAPFAVPVVTQ